MRAEMRAEIWAEMQQVLWEEGAQEAVLIEELHENLLQVPASTNPGSCAG